jgi:hypothetical protein
LAQRFERANVEFISQVDMCSDYGWRSVCKDENWSVGVTAHHVAANHLFLLDATRALIGGTPLPPNVVEIGDQFNAEHARTAVNCTREETVELLRRNGETAAAFIRSLNDDQLDQTSPMPFAGNALWTTQQWIENIVIGHADMHAPKIRVAMTGSSELDTRSPSP